MDEFGRALPVHSRVGAALLHCEQHAGPHDKAIEALALEQAAH
jgi:hypothetical protein